MTILKDFPPEPDKVMVKLSWHPYGEVRLSEFKEMMTGYVHIFIEKEKYINAKSVHIKKAAN